MNKIRAVIDTNVLIKTIKRTNFEFFIYESFADLAISSNADCLITFDKHFNIFREIEFPRLTVLDPVQFQQLLSKPLFNK